MPRPKAPCGTDAAYRRHLRNDERIDAACRDAHASARRTKRAPLTASVDVTATDSNAADAGSGDDMQLIVNTLRTAFVAIAEKEPTKLAPIAREFRAAVAASQGGSEKPEELSLADQLAEARAARAARAKSQDATA